jgi:hypothetical protein
MKKYHCSLMHEVATCNVNAIAMSNSASYSHYTLISLALIHHLKCVWYKTARLWQICMLSLITTQHPTIDKCSAMRMRGTLYQFPFWSKSCKTPFVSRKESGTDRQPLYHRATSQQAAARTKLRSPTHWQLIKKGAQTCRSRPVNIHGSGQ